MKLNKFVLGLVALLCSFAGTASAQTSCLAPHFSSGVVWTATIPNSPIPTTIPINETVTLKQTVTATGYTSLSYPCTQMVTLNTQHWITVTNRMTVSGVQNGGVTTSARNCASCSYSLTANDVVYFGGSDGLEIMSEDSYDLYCNSAGHFGGGGSADSVGSFIRRYMRIMYGTEEPDPLKPVHDCHVLPATGIQNCVIPTVTLCGDTIEHATGLPAVNTIDITDVWSTPTYPQVLPPPAKWWNVGDLCERLPAVPANSVPWLCPNYNIKPIRGAYSLPIPMPWGEPQFTLPTTQYGKCNDKFAP